MRKSDLVQINEYLWEIPKEGRDDARVPARLYASKALLDEILEDKSLKQLSNLTTLPGIQRYALAMPDIHQGYGFPIGGVVATLPPDGIISPGGIGYDINCLAGDTPVLHEHGYTRPIGEMAQTWQSARLSCFALDDPKYESARPVHWFGRPPEEPVYRLVTNAGDEIVATGDHPFWTPDGMVPLDALDAGDRIARYPFRGVPYEQPDASAIVTEEAFTACLRGLGKSEAGNAIGQSISFLRDINLLPLHYDSPATPYLCKILGFIFGDGSVRFVESSGKGIVSFYGPPEDLEEIRRDLQRIGISPSRVYSRERPHSIETAYDEYEVERTETWFAVRSTAFTALLHCLGAPLGRKTTQEYEVPAWLRAAPRWQQRLFLAALFSAELSSPQTVTDRGYNFQSPTLSMNKHDGYVASGETFLRQIADMLEGFGVAVHPIARRPEQRNQNGVRSLRLRLVVASDPENLIRLWGTIGYEYNRKRRALAAAATHYLTLKQHYTAARRVAAEEAVALSNAGYTTQAIVEELAGDVVNRRFIERSLYTPRTADPRAAAHFPTFDEYLHEATRGLGDSGMVWDRVARIEPADAERVYDFTVDHPDHNFVAGGFVVSNCGVRLMATELDEEEVKPELDDLATLLYKYCPSGVGKDGLFPLTVKELEAVVRDGAEWCLKNGYATEDDLVRTEEGGRLDGADPSKISKKAKDRGRSQLATLGGGNHFLEVDVVRDVFDADAADAFGLRPNQVVVFIHCGSRGFGHQICTDYVRSFQKAVHDYDIQLPDRELVCAPLGSEEGQSYLKAMRGAANFAFANRQVLAHQVRRAFEEVFAPTGLPFHLHQVYDLAHNIGKLERHRVDGEVKTVCVHRKGATRAFGPGSEDVPEVYRGVGQPVLVPGSMGTESYVLAGTNEAMDNTFGTCCHGAGRAMSRTQARKTIHGNDLRQQLEAQDITVRAGSLRGLAEEAPFAYKDVRGVIDVVEAAGLARTVARVEPIAVIKG